MALTYEIDSKLKELSPIIDEHAEWYNRVMRAVFYPERSGDPFDPPQSFNTWMHSAAQDDFVAKVTLERLRKIQVELYEMASDLMHEALTSGARPDFKIYDEFTNLYDDLVYQLRRMEHDAVQADTGMDVATGLRSKKAMTIDLEREMERRARRGKPFCLAIAQIDSYDQIRGLVTEERHREILAAVARLIKKCIRSFDDAYRSGDGEFIMCLKHSDVAGGTAANNRLRRYLEEEAIVVQDEKGRNFTLTMSSCVAEPLPGDSLEDLLANMRNDLTRFHSMAPGSTTLEYFEQSPLSRYVQELDS
ncbi:MAG: diguanylate cyclase [Alphaproteobacteria bacterium]|nr:diguanylate cyclase [Alphaproteobacteria bacterium]